MNIKMTLDPNDPMRKQLESLGIMDDPSSEYQISRICKGVNYIQAKKGDQQFYVDVKEIVFIESLAHDILIHTKGEVFNSRESLRYYETVLDTELFLRISNSCIINRKQIRRIESSILQKFVLHLSDGSKVDVTRSYYYAFKDAIGI